MATVFDAASVFLTTFPKKPCVLERGPSGLCRGGGGVP